MPGAQILAKHPHLKGSVLDLSRVFGERSALWDARLGVAGRCDFIAGDMFKEVSDADAYIMKYIIHDWNDEERVRILSNLRRRAPRNGRVFIAEWVVPRPETPHFSKFFTFT